ncbi:hypothetical protein MFIFM68171_04909 [Madurella fahalii]|uniref:Uncharacterized protein n=1 Tax=Madurella fahalii TaxID=1157608 RepID=A0ABQ0GAK3_9PEZI
MEPTNYPESSNGQTVHLEQAIRLVVDDAHVHITALQRVLSTLPLSPFPIMPVMEPLVTREIGAWFASHAIALELLAVEAGHDSFKSVGNANLVVMLGLISMHI